jgi:UDP-N-acetylmuramate dehydrogenase
MVSAVPPRPTGGPSAALDAVAAALGDRARRHAPFGARTTYRVGGEAGLLVEAASEDDLVAVHRALVAAPDVVPLLVLGEGSNLLVSDAGFPGVVIRLGTGFDWVGIEASTVRAGAGAKLPVVARKSAAAGLHGLEWGVGVPGSVGGALRMNAGGHGSDIAAVLARCRVFDMASGEAAVLEVARLALGYRTSALADGAVVVWAEFSLEPGDSSDAQRVVTDIVRWRREHQPGGPNAGSVFMNPEGDSAGRLVETAGLKGMRMGSAEVSTKHANFIQADRGGSADDVWRLVHHVRAEVLARTGVDLVPEVRAVGFDLHEPSTSTSTRGRGS